MRKKREKPKNKTDEASLSRTAINLIQELYLKKHEQSSDTTAFHNNRSHDDEFIRVHNYGRLSFIIRQDLLDAYVYHIRQIN